MLKSGNLDVDHFVLTDYDSGRTDREMNSTDMDDLHRHQTRDQKCKIQHKLSRWSSEFTAVYGFTANSHFQDRVTTDGFATFFAVHPGKIPDIYLVQLLKLCHITELGMQYDFSRT